MNGPVIKKFREILFWPLEIPKLGRHADETVRCKFENDFLRSGHWHREPDLLHRGLTAEEGSAYAELVYFHPFVQRFLYGKESPLRLYRRDDIQRARVELKGHDGTVLDLAVARVHFYLFEYGAALLAVEVHAENLPLKQVEDLLDQFRRAYPPYWESRDNLAGHCPKQVEWLSNGVTLATSDYAERQVFEKFVEEHKLPPVARHWQTLLDPLKPCTSTPTDEDFVFRQIEDERMPFMAYLSLDDPAILTRGDFVRLCFADGFDKSTRLPYASDFLKGFERDYAYDRFWDPEKHYAEEAPADDPERNSWMTTRYLCCGYGFVMIGQDEPYFYADACNGALSHFRRHYFQMGLIAHFHRAMLLMLSDDLSEAVAHSRDDRKRFHNEVNNILERLLGFTQRYWFREVTNQMQGQELFDRWSRHLDTRGLFDQVKQEAQDAKNFLDMREQQSQTETTVRLTVVATVGLAAGLVGTYLTISDWKLLPVASLIVGLGTVGVLATSKALADWIERISRGGTRADGG
jgi:hypothetical protein